MENTIQSYQEIISDWQNRKVSIEDAALELKNQISDDLHIEEVIKAYKQKLHDHKQQNGFILTGIGSLLCLISCVLTILNPIPEYRYLILIGLTSIGTCIIFAGFYMIFED